MNTDGNMSFMSYLLDVNTIHIRAVEEWKQKIAVHKTTQEWKRKMFEKDQMYLQEENERLAKTIKLTEKKCKALGIKREQYHAQYMSLVNQVAKPTEKSPKRTIDETNETQIDESPRKKRRSLDSHTEVILDSPPKSVPKTSAMQTSILIEDDDNDTNKFRKVKPEPISPPRVFSSPKPRRLTAPKLTALFDEDEEEPPAPVYVAPEIDSFEDAHPSEDEEDYEFMYEHGINKLDPANSTALAEAAKEASTPKKKTKEKKKEKASTDSAKKKEVKKKEKANSSDHRKERDISYYTEKSKSHKEKRSTSTAVEVQPQTEEIHIEETEEEIALRTAPRRPPLSQSELDKQEKERLQEEIKSKLRPEPQKKGKSTMTIVRKKATETQKEVTHESDSDSEEGRRFLGIQKEKEKPNYKYQEVVRKKSERSRLNSYECEECRAFLDAIGEGIYKNDEDRQKLIKRCSRHKANDDKWAENTPSFYWNNGTNFSDDEVEEDSQTSNTKPEQYYSPSIASRQASLTDKSLTF